MTGALDREEFVAGYLAEVDELLRGADAALVAVDAALKTGEAHHRLVRELFRSLHTLKGLSAMVGVDPVVDLTHEMESLLRAVDKAGGRASPAVVDVLAQGLKAIELRVGAFAQKKPVPPASTSLLSLVAEAALSLSSPSSSAAALLLDPEIAGRLSPSEQDELKDALARGRRALRFDFVPSPLRSAAGLSITAVRERLSSVATLVKVVPRSLPKSDTAPGGLSFVLLLVTDKSDAELKDAVGLDDKDAVFASLAGAVAADDDVAVAADDEADADADVARSDSIRVDAWRLDDALEKLSSLVVSRFRLVRAVTALRERGVDVRELGALVADNGQKLGELRGAIIKARMVSVAGLLERVPLIVRGMSRSTGKQVRLVLDAGRAELDKAVADRVFPAIVHLVRNAVDHAVEKPDEREAAGKSKEATITVSCFERAGGLEIVVADDGRGIDAAAVAARAGVAVPEDDGALLSLITRPGLSTLQTATAHSGRGLGMDIVKRVVVDVLGGDLALVTTKGRGTRFTLRVPLSVSIVDSFAFECGAQPFVVPVSAVEEIVELRPELVFRPPTTSQAPISSSSSSPSSSSSSASAKLLQRRGESVPLFDLARVFSLAESAAPAGFSQKALVVRRRGAAWAFAVDRMLGQQEVVVRPLEDPLLQVPGVSGTTDLGDGRPTLVVDLVGLTARLAAVAGRAGAL